MQLPDLKQLKQLAAACRKAGIKTIKCDGVEITLSEDAPPESSYKRAKASRKILSNATTDQPLEDGEEIVPTDAPSQEALLFWSTTAPGEEEESKAVS